MRDLIEIGYPLRIFKIVHALSVREALRNSLWITGTSLMTAAQRAPIALVTLLRLISKEFMSTYSFTHMCCSIWLAVGRFVGSNRAQAKYTAWSCFHEVLHIQSYWLLLLEELALKLDHAVLFWCQCGLLFKLNWVWICNVWIHQVKDGHAKRPNVHRH